MEKNLSLKIGRSRWILAYLCLLHMLMLWTIWQMDLSLVIAVVVSILLCVSIGYQLGRYQWVSSGLAIVEVNYQASEQGRNAAWILHYADGRALGPYQLVSSVVVAELVIIRFRASFQTTWRRRYETVVVVEDGVITDDFRRLRVMLRSINQYDTE